MLRYISKLATREVISLGQQYLSPAFQTCQIYDQPFAITEGDMQYLWGGLENEIPRRFIDLTSMNLTVSLGYDYPVIEYDQLHHCNSMFYHQPLAEFAKEIIATLPPHPSGDPWVVHPTNSGSEAIDLVYQITALNAPVDSALLTLTNSSHGFHGVALQATDMSNLTHKSPYMRRIHHIKPDVIEFDRYRHLQGSIKSSIGSLLVEPIQGCGFRTLPDGFMKYTFDHVKKMNGLTFVDEIQTLFRTGRMWAFEDHGVIPDGIVFGKGIANGLPLSGLICRRSLTQKFAKKRVFNSFAGNPIACSAARSTLSAVFQDNLLNHSLEMGRIFRDGLSRLCKEYPMLYKEVRGSNGLYQGLVIDGKTAEKARKHATEIQNRLRDHYDVVVGKSGICDNVFRIHPPLAIEEHDIRHVINSLEEAGWVYITEQEL
jgi:alanine-glyoxylate transaminase/(R)-3-amino-2-methylpropionate-pyruvate transaminase